MQSLQCVGLLTKSRKRLSQKSGTVAENGETTATFGRIRRQSHFSATNCRTFLRQCGQAITLRSATTELLVSDRFVDYAVHFDDINSSTSL